RCFRSAILVGFSAHPFRSRAQTSVGGTGLIRQNQLFSECAAIGELQMEFPTSHNRTWKEFASAKGISQQLSGSAPVALPRTLLLTRPLVSRHCSTAIRKAGCGSAICGVDILLACLISYQLVPE